MWRVTILKVYFRIWVKETHKMHPLRFSENQPISCLDSILANKKVLSDECELVSTSTAALPSYAAQRPRHTASVVVRLALK